MPSNLLAPPDTTRFRRASCYFLLRGRVAQYGRTRMSSGGTRLVHTREIAILNQFRDELGEEGPTIASALLRMGRGRLG